MVVVTRTEALVAYRRSVVELLARRYPASAIADAPGKEFHRWLGAFGLSPRGAEAVDAGLQDRSHPYIAVDMSRCIDCYRCVRICQRGAGPVRLARARPRRRRRASCPTGRRCSRARASSCGACVDTCPTGALEDRSAVATRRRRPLDPHHVSVLRRRLRDARRHARTARSCRSRPVLDAPVSKGTCASRAATRSTSSTPPIASPSR